MPPSILSWLLLFVLKSLTPEAAHSLEFDTLYHSDMRQNVFMKDKIHYLNVGRLGTYTVHDIFDCTFECLSSPSCQSLNLAASKGADGKLWCELLSSTNYSNPEVYKENASSHHFLIKTPCLSSPCQNGGTCQHSLKYHSFRCNCKEGFIGEYCEEIAGNSCKDVYDAYRWNMSQRVTLILDSKPTSVLCHMGDFGCGDGGWTPVMKIDGSKQTFHYDSSLWSNNETFNLAGGKTGFDTQETKLPTYWNTSFSKICLGMKRKDTKRVNFIVINKAAESFYSLIANGKYHHTTLGVATWKKLIGAQASMQTGCFIEGFNARAIDIYHARVRVGIVGNNENVCHNCDSRIGFGGGGNHDDSNTCGNEAVIATDNGDQHIKTMGFILVQ